MTTLDKECWKVGRGFFIITFQYLYCNQNAKRDRQTETGRSACHRGRWGQVGKRREIGDNGCRKCILVEVGVGTLYDWNSIMNNFVIEHFMVIQFKSTQGTIHSCWNQTWIFFILNSVNCPSEGSSPPSALPERTQREKLLHRNAFSQYCSKTYQCAPN